MVELQRTIDTTGHQTAIYAISYDPVETLAAFSESHGITYPLLADVGSRVITELGILNTTIEAERAAYGRAVEARHRGLPYPGTFVLDRDGTVIERHFETSHRIRPTTRSLLAPLEPGIEPELAAEAATPGVQLRATSDTGTVSANQLITVGVDVAVEPGSHLYVEPVPDGYTPLSMTIGGSDHICTRDPVIPPGRRFEVQGLPEEFRVVDGTIRLESSFFFVSGRDTAGDDTETIEVEVGIGFQVCTDTTCLLPERVVLTLPVELVPNPAYESVDRASLRPLVIRRLDEQPRTFGDLHARVAAAVQGGVAPEAVQAMLNDLAAEGLVEKSGDIWTIIRID